MKTLTGCQAIIELEKFRLCNTVAVVLEPCIRPETIETFHDRVPSHQVPSCDILIVSIWFAFRFLRNYWANGYILVHLLLVLKVLQYSLSSKLFQNVLPKRFQPGPAARRACVAKRPQPEIRQWWWRWCAMAGEWRSLNFKWDINIRDELQRKERDGVVWTEEK